MSGLTPFTFEQHEIRTIIDEHGDPWFVAADVCAALNITNNRDALEKLDDDEKGVGLTDTPGGQQEVGTINESGLYTLILRCRDAVKKGTAPYRFRKWVTSEVLPAIRKTGRYALPTDPIISPAQQRQLQNAIAERFPEGKHRPYAWGRFNNHFSLGSYKQLPASRLDEALAYIAQMPVLAPVETDRERQAREALKFGRFILSFDHNGQMALSEVPKHAFVATGEQIITLVGESSEIPRERLPDLIENAARRLKAS